MIELLIVMAIIVVLAGLVLGTYGYVQRKGSTSRAEAEIKAIEAACESYKADNGVYPRAAATDTLDAKTNFDPDASEYAAASLALYTALSGDSDADGAADSGKTYMPFKQQMLSLDPTTKAVQYIRDPFGKSYGYSTANQTDSNKGYNPTFDLWSTAGTTTDAESAGKAKWVKNW